MLRPFFALADGRWVTEERMIAYPVFILTLTVAFIVYVLWLHGGMLPNGAPFGSDFVSFWVAARQAVAGTPLVPYDRALFEPAQAAIFTEADFFSFYYPPHYLAYLMPLGVMPYYGALLVWLVAGFAATAWSLWLISGKQQQVIILALAFPAAFLTIAHGQNTFLSAALFGGGLWLLPRKPVLAGILFGLLTFKPQLGLLIPLALLAAGQWRAIISAAATLAGLVVVSAALFGVEIWAAFIAQGDVAINTLQLGLVDWHKMISSYAALRLLGFDDGSAMMIHGALAVAVAAIIVWAWLPSSGVAHATRSALLLTGALIATPFGLNYDLFVLAPALVFLARQGLEEGFLSWEKTVMALTYMAPFVLLPLMAAKIGPASLIVLALFVLIARRALHEHVSSRSAAAIQPAE